MAEVLYHEIGHHLHRTVAREHEETENVAEKWRRRLSRYYLRRKYWYFIPVAYLTRRLYRMARVLARSKPRFGRRRPFFSKVRTRALGKQDLREDSPPIWKKDHE